MYKRINCIIILAIICILFYAKAIKTVRYVFTETTTIYLLGFLCYFSPCREGEESEKVDFWQIVCQNHNLVYHEPSICLFVIIKLDEITLGWYMCISSSKGIQAVLLKKWKQLKYRN